MDQSQSGKPAGPMRITLLITCLQMGGAEQQVAALARQYLSLGLAVSVISLMPGCEVKLPEGVETLMLALRKTPLALLATLMQIRRFVLRWRPDVIHAHLVHANLVARLLTRVCPVPATICTAHNYMEGSTWRMLAYRLTDRWADLTTQVSDEGRQRMIEVRAAPETRIIYMPNGFDTTRYRPSAEQRAATRAGLAWARAPVRPQRWPAGAGQGPGRPHRCLRAGLPRARHGADDRWRRSAARCPGAAHRTARAERARASAGPAGGRAGAAECGGSVRAVVPDRRDATGRGRSVGVRVPGGLHRCLGCPGHARHRRHPGPSWRYGGIGARIGDAVPHGRGEPADEAARHQHIATAFNIEVIAREWLRLYARLASAGAAPHVETTDAAARYQ